MFIYFYRIKPFPPSEYLKQFTLEIYKHKVNETAKIQNKEERRRKNSDSLAKEGHFN